MDKGSPDNPRGSPDNPSRFEAASEWTRVCRTTLHDLRRPPNGHGFDKDSPDNPSRLEAGQDNPRGVLQLDKSWAAPTLHDLRWSLTTQGLVLSKPKIGKSMTGPSGPEQTPNAKPKFCPTLHDLRRPPNPQRLGALLRSQRSENE